MTKNSSKNLENVANVEHTLLILPLIDSSLLLVVSPRQNAPPLAYETHSSLIGCQFLLKYSIAGLMLVSLNDLYAS